MKVTQFTPLLLAATLVVALGGGRAHAGEVLAAVASNFTGAARDLVPRFEEATGHRVRTSFASTGMLFSQIDNGAPFEVFLAADSERPARAVREGLAVAGTRFTYATGRLVLWSVEAGRFDGGEAYVRSLAFSRAAIANPATAPYGLAARQVLQHLGVWGQTRPRLVRGDNISQTFQFTATGNVDVGFVALSQVRAWKKEPGTLWEIPDAYYAPIVQQAVLLKKGEGNPAARAFLDFLRSPEARRVMAACGYRVE